MRGDVLPMIQKMERFTKNATKPDSNTRPWVSKVKGTVRKKERGKRGRKRGMWEREGEVKTVITDMDKRGLVPRF